MKHKNKQNKNNIRCTNHEAVRHAKHDVVGGEVPVHYPLVFV